MGRTHFLPADRVHYAWNNRLPLALEVEILDLLEAARKAVRRMIGCG
jgi:hypothetical protein